MIQSNTSSTDNSGPAEPTPDQATIDQQVSLRESLISNVESDIQNLTVTVTDGSGSNSGSDAQLAMTSSVSILSKLLTNTYFVNDKIVQ